MLKGVQHTASRLSKLSAGVQTNDTVFFSYFDLKVFFFFKCKEDYVQVQQSNCEEGFSHDFFSKVWREEELQQDRKSTGHTQQLYIKKGLKHYRLTTRWEQKKRNILSDSPTKTMSNKYQKHANHTSEQYTHIF